MGDSRWTVLMSDLATVRVMKIVRFLLAVLMSIWLLVSETIWPSITSPEFSVMESAEAVVAMAARNIPRHPNVRKRVRTVMTMLPKPATLGFGTTGRQARRETLAPPHTGSGRLSSRRMMRYKE